MDADEIREEMEKIFPRLQEAHYALPRLYDEPRPGDAERIEEALQLTREYHRALRAMRNLWRKHEGKKT
jgi:hypothetical protein